MNLVCCVLTVTTYRRIINRIASCLYDDELNLIAGKPKVLVFEFVLIMASTNSILGYRDHMIKKSPKFRSLIGQSLDNPL